MFDGFGDDDASDMGEPLAVDEDHVKGAVYVVDGCVFVVGDDGGAVRGKLDVLDFDFGRHILFDAVFRHLAKQRDFDVTEAVGGLAGAVATGVVDIIAACGVEVFLSHIFHVIFDGVAALHAEHQHWQYQKECSLVFHVLCVG